MSWQLTAVLVAAAILGSSGLVLGMLWRTSLGRKMAGALFVSAAIFFGGFAALMLVFLPFAYMGYIAERALLLAGVSVTGCVACGSAGYWLFKRGRMPT